MSSSESPFAEAVRALRAVRAGVCASEEHALLIGSRGIPARQHRGASQPMAAAAADWDFVAPAHVALRWLEEIHAEGAGPPRKRLGVESVSEVPGSGGLKVVVATADREIRLDIEVPTSEEDSGALMLSLAGRYYGSSSHVFSLAFRHTQSLQACASR